MDNAGQASTDRRSDPSLGCDKEPTVKKLSSLVYPLVAIASIMAAGSAFADDPTIDNTVYASTKSREQVQRELFAARADGSIKAWSISYNPLTVAQSTKARAEVKSEAIAARADGFGSSWYGEDSGSFALARQPAAHAAGPVYAALTK